MCVQLRALVAASSVAVTFAIVSPSAEAVDFVVQMGIHGGGDEIANATFTSGDSQRIKAGELLSVAAGIVLPINDSFEAQGTIGWKFDSITADNGDIEWDRFPLDLLLFYRATENVRVGAGISYHVNPKLSGSGAASAINVDFDNALGFATEVGYSFGKEGAFQGVYLGLNFTAIDYKVSPTQAKVDGNSIGLILGYRF